MSAPIPLRCPYCGGQLYVEMTTVGSAYMTYEIPDGFGCGGTGCYASWDRDGKPVDWPGKYEEEPA